MNSNLRRANAHRCRPLVRPLRKDRCIEPIPLPTWPLHPVTGRILTSQAIDDVEKTRKTPPKWAEDIPDRTKGPLRAIDHCDGPAGRPFNLRVIGGKMHSIFRGAGNYRINNMTIDALCHLLEDPQYYPVERFIACDRLRQDPRFRYEVAQAHKHRLISPAHVARWLDRIQACPMLPSTDLLTRVVSDLNGFPDIWFATAKAPSRLTPSLLELALARGREDATYDITTNPDEMQSFTTVLHPDKARKYIAKYRSVFIDMTHFLDLDDVVPAVAIQDVWDGDKLVVAAGQEHLVCLASRFDGRMTRTLTKLAHETRFPVVVRRSDDYYSQGVLKARSSAEQETWNKRRFDMAIEQYFRLGESLKQVSDHAIPMPSSDIGDFNLQHILGATPVNRLDENAINLEVCLRGDPGIEAVRLVVDRVQQSSKRQPPPKETPCYSPRPDSHRSSGTDSTTSTDATQCDPPQKAACGLIFEASWGEGRVGNRAEGLSGSGELPLTATVGVTVADFPYRIYRDRLNCSAHAMVSVVYKPGQMAKFSCRAALHKLLDKLPKTKIKRQPVLIHLAPRDGHF